MHVELKYSFGWAQIIIARHAEAHARATDICLRVLGFSSNQVAWMLARGGESSWEKWKSLVKHVERLCGQIRFEPEGPAFWAWAINVLDAAADLDLLNRRWALTRAKFIRTIAEHGLKEGVEGARGGTPAVGDRDTQLLLEF